MPMKIPTKTKHHKHLNQILKLLKTLEPEKVILFGSAATGRSGKDSDLDLCVIKRGDRLKIKREISNKLWQENYDWEIEPDIHVYDPNTYHDWLRRKDPFLEEIEKGQILYAKKK